MRTKKAFKNAFYSILYQIIAVVCGLITPRYILVAFGSSYNGVIASANQFLSMVSFLTLGIAGATRVALYGPLAANDVDAISRILKSNKKYMQKVGIVTIAYAIVLSVIYPFFAHNDLTKAESALIIAIVGFGAIAQYFFGISNQTLLTADQSVYIYFIVQMCATIANTVLTILLILFGCNIFVVKFFSSFVFFASPFILDRIVAKKYSLDKYCESDDSAIKGRGAVAFHSIANIIHDNTDLVILTLFTDAKLISVYTVYMLVVGKVRQILLMLSNGMEGAFGTLWKRKEIKAFESNYHFFEYLIYAFTSLIFSIVSIMIIPFIKLYTAGVNDVDYVDIKLAVLITITEAVYCIRHPYVVVVQATGNYEDTKLGAMIEAVINIVLSIILVMFWGIIGVIIGTLVANLFRTIQYALFISKRIVHNSIRETYRLVCWALCNTGVIIILDLLSSNWIMIDNWKSWILSGMINSMIAIIVTLTMSIAFYRNHIFKLVTMIGGLIKHE